MHMNAADTAPTNPDLRRLMQEVQKAPRRSRLSGDQVVDTSRMMDSEHEFHEVAKRAIDSMLAPPGEITEARAKRYRTHTCVWRPQAAGYLGHVTNGRWYNMVRTAIKGLLHDLQIPQPNGDWQLADGQFTSFFMEIDRQVTSNATSRDPAKEFQTTTQRRQVRFFLLGLEFIDMNGAQPLTYSRKDGTPTDALDTGNLSVSPEIAALLGSLQAAEVSRKQSVEQEEVESLRAEKDSMRSELDEVKAMLAQLLQGQIQSGEKTSSSPEAAQVATPLPGNPIDEPADEAPPAKRRRRRTKPKAEPPADDVDSQLDRLSQKV